MKNSFLIYIGAFGLLLGCTTSVVKYDSSENIRGRIKVALGARENVHVNDKIYVLEQKCVESPKVPLCKFSPIGILTVKEVKETYSLVEPDEEIIFKEGYYFKFAKHCEGNAEACKGE